MSLKTAIRRIGKGWILLAMMAMILLFSFIAGRTGLPSEYEFIRKYGPRHEFVANLADPAISGAPPMSSASWYRVFLFDELDPKLVEYLLTFEPLEMGPDKSIVNLWLPGNRMAFLHKGKKTLLISGEPPPNWFARQWIGIKWRTGITPRIGAGS